MTTARYDHLCPCGVSEPPQARRLVFCENCGAPSTTDNDDADYLCPACAAAAAQRLLAELAYTGPRCLACGDPVGRPSLCEACQEAGEAWPAPIVPPLSTRQCCLCDALLAAPGAPCPVCSIGPCLFCGGAHLFVCCPRVQVPEATS